MGLEFTMFGKDRGKNKQPPPPPRVEGSPLPSVAGGPGRENRGAGAVRGATPLPPEKFLSHGAPTPDNSAAVAQKKELPIPPHLHPATQALAEAVLRVRSERTWDELPRKLQDAVSALGFAEQQSLEVQSFIPDTTEARGERWTEVQQQIELLTTRIKLSGDQEAMEQLLNQKDVVAILPQMLGLMIMRNLMTNPLVQDIITNPSYSNRDIDMGWVQTQHPALFSELRRIGDFMKKHTDIDFSIVQGLLRQPGIAKIKPLLSACGLA